MQEALVNDVLECLEGVCITEAEILSNSGSLQGIGGSEDTLEAIPAPVQLQKSFEELENLAQRTGLLKAAGGLHTAKRAFLDAFCEQKKKGKKQTMIHEFFPD